MDGFFMAGALFSRYFPERGTAGYLFIATYLICSLFIWKQIIGRFERKERFPGCTRILQIPRLTGLVWNSFYLFCLASKWEMFYVAIVDAAV